MNKEKLNKKKTIDLHPFNGKMKKSLAKKVKQYALDEDMNQKDAIIELIEKGLKE